MSLNKFWVGELTKGAVNPVTPPAEAEPAPVRRSGDGLSGPISLWIPPALRLDGGHHNREARLGLGRIVAL